MQFGIFSSVCLVDYRALQSSLVCTLTPLFTVGEVGEAGVQTLLAQFLADVRFGGAASLPLALAIATQGLGTLLHCDGVFTAATAGPARQSEGSVRTARLLIAGRQVAVTVVLDADLLLHDVVQVQVPLTEAGGIQAVVLQFLIERVL